jgi:LPXTG-motif cell wall-anchored protein
MKRQILTIAAVLALVFAGAVFAQSSQNTTAPGPTMQQEPGLTNNNLPNPGNPIPDPAAAPNQPLQQEGTTPEATTTTGVAPETEQGEGMDVDIDTGARAEGAVDVDVTAETDADTDASGSGTETTTGTYGGDADALPATASDLPTVALLGLLALGAAFLVRAKRNA